MPHDLTNICNLKKKKKLQNNNNPTQAHRYKLYLEMGVCKMSEGDQKLIDFSLLKKSGDIIGNIVTTVNNTILYI